MFRSPSSHRPRHTQAAVSPGGRLGFVQQESFNLSQFFVKPEGDGDHAEQSFYSPIDAVLWALGIQRSATDFRKNEMLKYLTENYELGKTLTGMSNQAQYGSLLNQLKEGQSIYDRLEKKVLQVIYERPLIVISSTGEIEDWREDEDLKNYFAPNAQPIFVYADAEENYYGMRFRSEVDPANAIEGFNAAMGINAPIEWGRWEPQPHLERPPTLYSSVRLPRVRTMRRSSGARVAQDDVALAIPAAFTPDPVHESYEQVTAGVSNQPMIMGISSEALRSHIEGDRHNRLLRWGENKHGGWWNLKHHSAVWSTKGVDQFLGGGILIASLFVITILIANGTFEKWADEYGPEHQDPAQYVSTQIRFIIYGVMVAVALSVGVKHSYDWLVSAKPHEENYKEMFSERLTQGQFGKEHLLLPIDEVQAGEVRAILGAHFNELTTKGHRGPIHALADLLEEGDYPFMPVCSEGWVGETVTHPSQEHVVLTMPAETDDESDIDDEDVFEVGASSTWSSEPTFVPAVTAEKPFQLLEQAEFSKLSIAEKCAYLQRQASFRAHQAKGHQPVLRQHVTRDVSGGGNVSAAVERFAVMSGSEFLRAHEQRLQQSTQAAIPTPFAIAGHISRPRASSPDSVVSTLPSPAASVSDRLPVEQVDPAINDGEPELSSVTEPYMLPVTSGGQVYYKTPGGEIRSYPMTGFDQWDARDRNAILAGQPFKRPHVPSMQKPGEHSGYLGLNLCEQVMKSLDVESTSNAQKDESLRGIPRPERLRQVMLGLANANIVKNSKGTDDDALAWQAKTLNQALFLSVFLRPAAAQEQCRMNDPSYWAKPFAKINTVFEDFSWDEQARVIEALLHGPEICDLLQYSVLREGSHEAVAYRLKNVLTHYLKLKSGAGEPGELGRAKRVRYLQSLMTLTELNLGKDPENPNVLGHMQATLQEQPKLTAALLATLTRHVTTEDMTAIKQNLEAHLVTFEQANVEYYAPGTAYNAEAMSEMPYEQRLVENRQNAVLVIGAYAHHHDQIKQDYIATIEKIQLVLEAAKNNKVAVQQHFEALITLCRDNKFVASCASNILALDTNVQFNFADIEDDLKLLEKTLVSKTVKLERAHAREVDLDYIHSLEDVKKRLALRKKARLLNLSMEQFSQVSAVRAHVGHLFWDLSTQQKIDVLKELYKNPVKNDVVIQQLLSPENLACMLDPERGLIDAAGESILGYLFSDECNNRQYRTKIYFALIQMFRSEYREYALGKFDQYQKKRPWFFNASLSYVDDKFLIELAQYVSVTDLHDLGLTEEKQRQQVRREVVAYLLSHLLNDDQMSYKQERQYIYRIYQHFYAEFNLTDPGLSFGRENAVEFLQDILQSETLSEKQHQHIIKSLAKYMVENRQELCVTLGRCEYTHIFSPDGSYNILNGSAGNNGLVAAFGNIADEATALEALEVPGASGAATVSDAVNVRALGCAADFLTAVVEEEHYVDGEFSQRAQSMNQSLKAGDGLHKKYFYIILMQALTRANKKEEFNHVFSSWQRHLGIRFTLDDLNTVVDDEDEDVSRMRDAVCSAISQAEAVARVIHRGSQHTFATAGRCLPGFYSEKQLIADGLSSVREEIVADYMRYLAVMVEQQYLGDAFNAGVTQTLRDNIAEFMRGIISGWPLAEAPREEDYEGGRASDAYRQANDEYLARINSVEYERWLISRENVCRRVATSFVLAIINHSEYTPAERGAIIYEVYSSIYGENVSEREETRCCYPTFLHKIFHGLVVDMGLENAPQLVESMLHLGLHYVHSIPNLPAYQEAGVALAGIYYPTRNVPTLQGAIQELLPICKVACRDTEQGAKTAQFLNRLFRYIVANDSAEKGSAFRQLFVNACITELRRQPEGEEPQASVDQKLSLAMLLVYSIVKEFHFQNGRPQTWQTKRSHDKYGRENFGHIDKLLRVIAFCLEHNGNVAELDSDNWQDKVPDALVNKWLHELKTGDLATLMQRLEPDFDGEERGIIWNLRDYGFLTTQVPLDGYTNILEFAARVDEYQAVPEAVTKEADMICRAFLSPHYAAAINTYCFGEQGLFNQNFTQDQYCSVTFALVRALSSADTAPGHQVVDLQTRRVYAMNQLITRVRAERVDRTVISFGLQQFGCPDLSTMSMNILQSALRACRYWQSVKNSAECRGGTEEAEIVDANLQHMQQVVWSRASDLLTDISLLENTEENYQKLRTVIRLLAEVGKFDSPWNKEGEHICGYQNPTQFTKWNQIASTALYYYFARNAFQPDEIRSGDDISFCTAVRQLLMEINKQSADFDHRQRRANVGPNNTVTDRCALVESGLEIFRGVIQSFVADDAADFGAETLDAEPVQKPILYEGLPRENTVPNKVQPAEVDNACNAVASRVAAAAAQVTYERLRVQEDHPGWRYSLSMWVFGSNKPQMLMNMQRPLVRHMLKLFKAAYGDAMANLENVKIAFKGEGEIQNYFQQLHLGSWATWVSTFLDVYGNDPDGEEFPTMTHDRHNYVSEMRTWSVNGRSTAGDAGERRGLLDKSGGDDANNDYGGVRFGA